MTTINKNKSKYWETRNLFFDEDKGAKILFSHPEQVHKKIDSFILETYNPIYKLEENTSLQNVTKYTVNNKKIEQRSMKYPGNEGEYDHWIFIPKEIESKEKIDEIRKNLLSLM